MNDQYILKIDSAQAREDVLQLGKALDGAGRAFKRMDRDVAKSVTGMDASLNRATRTMAKYAEVMVLVSKIKIAGSGGIMEMGKALDSIGRAKSVTPTQLGNLEKFFALMRNATPLTGARAMVKDLNEIAIAAERAAVALRMLPSSLRSVGGAAGGVNRVMRETEERTRGAHGGIVRLSGGLGGLSGRFNLAYQAGTLFGAMFSAFTMGAFVKSIYDTNIQLLKLQKAVLFATGSFDDAKLATKAYIGISNELGLSIKDNIDTYGRFVIAATASKIPLEETNRIYKSIGTALTVVGSSAQQQQLAFYGLTEMMQKGVVYSKEFNRQIGAQLPGNAVLGARALSDLEGHAVSVTEFFKRMHSGTLLSADFIPAWAKQVEAMYKPLLALAQQRPDVALNRLKNAFITFAQEVGGGKFMSAISKELTSLTSMFITGEGEGAHLTVMAQNLADSLGQNLTQGVHLLGEGLKFVAEHFDEIVTGLKVLFAFNLAKKFFDWGSAAFAASGMIGKLAGELTTVTKVKAVSTIAGATSGDVGLAASLLNVGGVSRATEGIAREAHLMHRWSGALVGGEDMGLAALAIGGGPQGAVSSASRFASVEAGPMTAFASSVASSASALTGFAIAAAAAVAILYAIRPYNTGSKSAHGNDITYGDIEDSGFAQLGRRFEYIGNIIGNILKNIGTGFDALFGSLDVGGKILTALENVFLIMFDNMITPFKLLIQWVGTFIDAVVTGASIIKSAMGGDFKGAFAQGQAFLTRQFTNYASDPFGNVAVLPGAGASADQRAAQRDNNNQDDAAAQSIMAALSQQRAAQSLEDASTALYDSAAGFRKNFIEPNNKQIDAMIAAIVKGDFANQGQAIRPGDIGSGVGNGGFTMPARSAQNATVMDAIYKASAVAGVNPQLMIALANAESRMNPYATNTKTGAGGLYQFLPSTAADLGAKYGKFNRYDPYASTIMAARNTANDSAYLAAHGNPIVAPEAYIPHLLGAAGANRFLTAERSYPDSPSTSFIGAGVAKNNPQFFYGKDGKTLSLRDSMTRMINALSGGGNTSAALQALGGGGNGIDEKTADAISQKNETDLKAIMAYAAGANPSYKAQMDYMEKKLTLKENLQNLAGNQILTGPGSTSGLTPTIIAGLNVRDVRDQRDVADAADPFAKMHRLAQEEADVTKLRNAGMMREADLLAELNKKREEGYDITQLMTDATRAQYLADKQLVDVLKLQGDYLAAINAADVTQRIRAENDPVKAEFLRLANAQKPPNVSLDDYLGDKKGVGIGPQGNVALMGTATTNVKSNTFGAINDLQDVVDKMKELQGLNPFKRQIAEDWSNTLSRILGVSGQTMETMAKTFSTLSQEQQDNVKKLFMAKEALEHPLGLDAWVQSVEPFEQKLEDVKATFIDGFSTQFANLVVDGKADFASLLKDAGRSIVKNAIDNGIKSLLGDVGLGKPDGTAFNPIYTRSVDTIPGLGGAGGGSGGFGDILGSIVGGSKGNSLFGGSSLFGSSGFFHDLFNGGGGAGSTSSGILSMFSDIGSLFGFATGGSFKVGGSGGTDSQVVAFKATPGENVVVGHDNQMGGGDMHVNIIDQRQGGGPAVQTQERRGANGQRVVDVLIVDAMKRAISDGHIDTTMNRVYGVSRQGQTR